MPYWQIAAGSLGRDYSDGSYDMGSPLSAAIGNAMLWMK